MTCTDAENVTVQGCNRITFKVCDIILLFSDDPHAPFSLLHVPPLSRNGSHGLNNINVTDRSYFLQIKRFCSLVQSSNSSTLDFQRQCFWGCFFIITFYFVFSYEKLFSSSNSFVFASHLHLVDFFVILSTNKSDVVFFFVSWQLCHCYLSNLSTTYWCPTPSFQSPPGLAYLFFLSAPFMSVLSSSHHRPSTVYSLSDIVSVFPFLSFCYFNTFNCFISHMNK